MQSPRAASPARTTAADRTHGLPKPAASAFASGLKALFGSPAARVPAAPATPAAPAAPAAPKPPAADTSLKALFGQAVPAAAPDTTPQAPTAESVFGPHPWMAAPAGQGPNGITFGYNPLFFATQSTAQKVAQMVGGTVVQSNFFTPNGGPFMQQQMNWMVQLPDGRQINPGLVAAFYTHGYPQSYIDGLIAGEVNSGGA